MQDNEFYRGVLFELEKLAVDAAPSTTPAVKTPVTAAPSATPAPTPQAQTTPFNFGKITLAPQEQGVVNEFKTNRSIYQPYLQRGEQYIKSLPRLKDYNQSELQKQMYNTGKEDLANKVIGGFAEGSVVGGVKGLFTGYQDTNKIKQTFDTFSKASPEHQLGMINEIAASDPHLAKFLQAQVQRGISEHANSAGFGDIAKDVLHGVTGSSDKPAGATTYSDVLMRDQNVKNFAKDALLGRAGKLTGEFLKNNWKILASVIGSGGLVALVYSLMKNHSQQQQNVPQYNKPAGPRFL